MTYCIVDRRQWKIVARANTKAELPKVAGFIVDTAHLERLKENEIFGLYSNIAHGSPVPPWAVEQIKKALEAELPAAGKGKKLGPVQMARAVFEEMKGKERKLILAECEARGINPGTAKTQYYKWSQGK